MHPTIAADLGNNRFLRNNLTKNPLPVLERVNENIPEGNKLLRGRIFANLGPKHSGLPGSVRSKGGIILEPGRMSDEARADLEVTAMKSYSTDPSNSIICVSETGQMDFELSDSIISEIPGFYRTVVELRSRTDHLAHELETSAPELVNVLNLGHSNLE